MIRAGEAGDRFYIVGDGALTIDVGSRSRSRRAPGTSSARSRCCATCRGRRPSERDTDARLYALERDDFLAVVTGNSLAHTEADAAAAERLARD